MKSFIESRLTASSAMIDSVQSTCMGSIETAAGVLLDAVKNGHTLFWCGNGGSAGQAQHLSAELVGGFHDHHRPPIKSISLTTDTSFITAWSNDTSYDTIFSRQLEGLGTSGDVLLALTTSGNSKNVLEALKAAKTHGITSILITGRDGGKAVSLADHVIIIPSDETQHIQEGHILVGHILCEYLEKEIM